MSKCSAVLTAPASIQSGKYTVTSSDGKEYIATFIEHMTTVTMKRVRWYHRLWKYLHEKAKEILRSLLSAAKHL